MKLLSVFVFCFTAIVAWAQQDVGKTESTAPPMREISSVPNLTGVWTGQYAGFHTPTAMRITIAQQDSATVSGQLMLVQQRCGGTFPLEGKIEGNTFEFKSEGGHCGVRQLKGTVTGDTIDGKFATGQVFSVKR